MTQEGYESKFETGDTWPVGSLRLSAKTQAVDLAKAYFTVPGWPELTGLGEKEELVGFWVDLYVKWEESEYSGKLLEEALIRRPGLEEFLCQFQYREPSIVKGQMIGPATLQWALRRHDYPVIDREKIIEFVTRAFRIQGRLLERVCPNTIVSLDEPCAFMVPLAPKLWELFFLELKESPNTTEVALHTCGLPKREWLTHPWRVVHLDATELTREFYQQKEEWKQAFFRFAGQGGWLALGVVPVSAIEIDEEDVFQNLDEFIELSFPLLLQRTMVSTSCGIGISDFDQAESRLRFLKRVQKYFREHGNLW